MRASGACMCQQPRPSLEILACCLVSTKSLSEPMLPYCQLNPDEHISVKLYLNFKSFVSMKCTLKCHLQKAVICLDLSMLR